MMADIPLGIENENFEWGSRGLNVFIVHSVLQLFLQWFYILYSILQFQEFGYQKFPRTHNCFDIILSA